MSQPTSFTLTSRQKEFIGLMAILMSLVALTIDSILPALSLIGNELQVANANDTQWVLSGVFLGMAFGLMLYGPIADSFGRKKALYLGIGIFLIGDLISILAQDFTLMVFGRIVQGFGAASCRVITTAMIRDKFEGQQMGRVMSLIMVLFVVVPALAPSVGQLILWVSNWRTIFIFVALVAATGLALLYFRQEETLAEKHRRPFSVASILEAMKETISHPTTRLYTIAAGIVFGSFIGYLSSSQQILQVQYQTGDMFAIYFGTLALAIGSSSFVNSKLVMKFQLNKLCLWALFVLTALSVCFYFYCTNSTQQPSLTVFLLYLGLVFFCFGILFGNLSTLAVQPLGHIAGIATSIISSVQTLISVAVGASIGNAYNGSVIPLIVGFILCGTTSFVLTFIARRKAKQLGV